MKSFSRLFILLLLLLLIGCEGTKTEDCATAESGRGHIISVLPFGSIGIDFLEDFIKENNLDIGVTPVTGIKVYSIVYETVDWNGEPGRLPCYYVPDEDHSGKIISYLFRAAWYRIKTIQRSFHHTTSWF